MTIDEIIDHLETSPPGIRWSSTPTAGSDKFSEIEQALDVKFPDQYRQLMRRIDQCELIGARTTLMFFRIEDLPEFNRGEPWVGAMKGMIVVGTDEGGSHIYLDPRNLLQRGADALFGVPMNVETFQGSTCLGRTISEAFESVIAGSDPFSGVLLSKESLGVPYTPERTVASAEEITAWDTWATGLSGPDILVDMISHLPAGVTWTARPPAVGGSIEVATFMLETPVPEAVAHLLQRSNGGVLKGSHGALWLYGSAQLRMLHRITRSARTPSGLMVIGDDASFFYFVIDTLNDLGGGVGAVYAVHRMLIPSEQLTEAILIGPSVRDLFRRIARGEDVLNDFYHRKYTVPPDSIRADY